MNNIIFDKVDAILENAQGNTLDICCTLYCEYVSQSENPGAVLQRILQYSDIVGTKDAPSEKVSDEVRNHIGNEYYTLLHEVVRLIMRENVTIDEFYQKLYVRVFESDLFPSGDVEQAVILWLLMEKIPEVPYFQAVNLLEKSDEEYREDVNRIKPRIIQAIHMLNRHFGSYTEETSQLVRIASEIEDESDRIVYWSALISLLTKDSEKELGLV